MRHHNAVLAAALLASLAACGGTAPSAAPPASSPTPDPLNAAACQQFDKASDSLTELGKLLGTGENNGSMLIAGVSQTSLEFMQGAAKLARGDIQQAMDRAVAALQIMHSQAATSPDGWVHMVNEVKAGREAVKQVDQACKGVGVTLTAHL